MTYTAKHKARMAERDDAFLGLLFEHAPAGEWLSDQVAIPIPELENDVLCYYLGSAVFSPRRMLDALFNSIHSRAKGGTFETAGYVLTWRRLRAGEVKGRGGEAIYSIKRRVQL